ncbi:MAG: hypothetical protein KF764_22100 [Labilithrix sp.]|nr:hypothetical protein [Labilithrix sp.]
MSTVCCWYVGIDVTPTGEGNASVTSAVAPTGEGNASVTSAVASTGEGNASVTSSRSKGGASFVVAALVALAATSA